MKRKLTLKSLLVAGLFGMGVTSAWAGDNATLTHTASSFCGGDGTAYTSTVDSEKEHVNNDKLDGATAWQGAAYAEFALNLPEGESITSATLKFRSYGESRRERNCDVKYANIGEALDYTELLAGNALVKLDATYISSVNIAKGAGAARDHEIDVKDAVKAIAEAGQAYIIFMFTGNPGGGDIAGKWASDVAPSLVIETANAATQTKYTVKFTDGTNELKDAVTYDGTIGDDASASETDIAAFFDADSQKWIYDAGNEPITLGADAVANVINLVFRKAKTYSYTVDSSLGTNLGTGSYFEGETVYVGYPRYEVVGTDLYQANATNKEYRATIELTEDNIQKTITYNKVYDTSVAFYSEAENIEGVTPTTTGNIPVRASNAMGATTSEDVVITTLPAGKYILHVGIFTSKSSLDVLSVNFGIGENTFEAQFGAVNLNEVASEEFEVGSSEDISFLASSSDGAQFDYIWIEQTDAPLAIPTIAEGYVTFSSGKALDFTTKTTKAYIAESISGNTVKMKRVYLVPANTGLVLQGTGNENIPILEEAAEDVSANLLKAADGSKVAASVEGTYHYVFAKQNDVFGFYNLTAETTVERGKAYLETTTELAEGGARIVFDDAETTGISSMHNAPCTMQNEIFNLNGQRVVKAQKGLYIQNGKKFMVK